MPTMSRILFTCLFALAFSSSPTTMKAAWTWSEPSPQGNALASAARSSNGSITIAVGDYGTVVRKSGSGTWESLAPIAEGVALSAAVWSGTKFLVTGPEAGLWESTDGLVWTLRDAAVSGPYLFSQPSTNDESTIICLGEKKVSISTGGDSFQHHALPALLASYQAAALSEGKLALLLANGTVGVSSDALNWTTYTINSSSGFYAIAGGSRGFLVAGYGPSPAYTPLLFGSVNGQAWTSVPLPVGASYASALFDSLEGWLFQNSSTGSIHRLSGAVWQTLSFSEGNLYPYASLLTGNSSTLLFGDRGAIATLGTGANMTLESASDFPSSLLLPSRFSAAASGNSCVAIDKNVNRPSQVRYYSTSDGLQWNYSEAAPIGGLSVVATVSGNVTGFSVGTNATQSGFYRLDSGGWALIAPNVDSASGADILPGSVVSLASNTAGTAILALVREEVYDLNGNYSARRGLYSSSNWTVWTPVSLPDLRTAQPKFESLIESVEWDGARFVMLLYPGRIFVSTDGKDWNHLPSLPQDSRDDLAADYSGATDVAPSNVALSVASNGENIVARAGKLDGSGAFISKLPSRSDKFFIYSQGRWWPQTVSKPVSPDRRRILWDGSKFYAIGDGLLLVSPNGFDWTSHKLNATTAAIAVGGSRLFAFTDTFGILSHELNLSNGAPIFSNSVNPRLKALNSNAQSYSLAASLDSGWSISGQPPWVTVTPLVGTGNATITVTALENKGGTPRGAILKIGGLTHCIAQLPLTSNTTILVSSNAAAISIPFAGNWSASASSALVQFSKNATTGIGKVSFTLPLNATPAPRTFNVNINGLDFTITQEGRSPSTLRAGDYTGIAGSVLDGYPPSSLDSYDTFMGSARFTLAAPSRKVGNGTYTAAISLFIGNQTLQFSSKGEVGENGTISGECKTSGKNPVSATMNLSVTDDSGFQKFLSGNVSCNGTTFGIYAGKQVFNARTAPLDSNDAGKATWFLTSFGMDHGTADTGVASLNISSSGIGVFTGSLADGTKFTASSTVWGAAGSKLGLPLAIPLLKGKSFLAGFVGRDATQEVSDWDGQNFTLSSAGKPPTFLSATATRYTPASRTFFPLSWESPAALLISADETIEGSVSLASLKLTSILTPPTRKFTLNLNPTTGIVTGSLSFPNSKSTALTVMGAVNSKEQSLAGDRGSMHGFINTGSQGTVSITPQ